MDWNKSKTILIIAFLFLNIFLGYKVWAGPPLDTISPWINFEEKKEVFSYLEANNIIYTGTFDEKVKTKNFYQVEGKHIDKREFFANFKQKIGEFNKIDKENFDLYFDSKNQMITIYDSGKIKFYFPRGYTPQNSFLTRGINDMMIKAVNWVGELAESLMGENIYLEKINFDNNSMELIYHQKMNDMNFYGGYFKVLVTPLGIEKGELFLLDFRGESETSIEVIPATTALLRIVNHLPSGTENVITEMDLGYYTQEFYAESWEAVPVWKISLEDSSDYYLNAFTGELEGKKEAFSY